MLIDDDDKLTMMPPWDFSKWSVEIKWQGPKTSYKDQLSKLEDTKTESSNQY